jgi:hypothetical protein
MFDGGPLHNKFLYLDQNLHRVDSTGGYYKETTTKYGGIPVFVWIELKPTENESNNEGIETK